MGRKTFLERLDMKKKKERKGEIYVRRSLPNMLIELIMSPVMNNVTSYEHWRQGKVCWMEDRTDHRDGEDHWVSSEKGWKHLCGQEPSLASVFSCSPPHVTVNPEQYGDGGYWAELKPKKFLCLTAEARKENHEFRSIVSNDWKKAVILLHLPSPTQSRSCLS